jgi:hypothetical protein
MREERRLTLFDYVPYLPSLAEMGFGEDELRRIPAHEAPDGASASGGSILGIGELPPDAPSADTSPLVPVGTRQLYAYESEVPTELWVRLGVALSSRGPSGFEKESILSGTPDVVIHDEDEPGRERAA